MQGSTGILLGGDQRPEDPASLGICVRTSIIVRASSSKVQAAVLLNTEQEIVNQITGKRTNDKNNHPKCSKE